MASSESVINWKYTCFLLLVSQWSKIRRQNQTKAVGVGTGDSGMLGRRHHSNRCQTGSSLCGADKSLLTLISPFISAGLFLHLATGGNPCSQIDARKDLTSPTCEGPSSAPTGAWMLGEHLRPRVRDKALFSTKCSRGLSHVSQPDSLCLSHMCGTQPRWGLCASRFVSLTGEEGGASENQISYQGKSSELCPGGRHYFMTVTKLLSSSADETVFQGFCRILERLCRRKSYQCLCSRALQNHETRKDGHPQMSCTCLCLRFWRVFLRADHFLWHFDSFDQCRIRPSLFNAFHVALAIRLPAAE